MSGAGNDETVFRENDATATEMAYDKGGVPFYVGLVWVVAGVGLAIYAFAHVVPDLRLWLAP